jgi:hypothetical protein
MGSMLMLRRGWRFWIRSQQYIQEGQCAMSRSCCTQCVAMNIISFYPSDVTSEMLYRLEASCHEDGIDRISVPITIESIADVHEDTMWLLSFSGRDGRNCSLTQRVPTSGCHLWLVSWYLRSETNSCLPLSHVNIHHIRAYHKDNHVEIRG